MVGVVGTLVLTHLIAPEIYGEVMVAVLLTFTVKAFSTFGFGQYLVANPTMGLSGVVHTAVLHLGFGIFGLVALLALGDLLAPYFHAPNLLDYLPALIGIQFISLFAFTPERMLVRNMHFRAVSITRAMGELGYAISAVGFAYFDLGGHAIVLGNLVRALIVTGAFAFLVKRKEWLTRIKIDKERIRDIFKFGVPLWVNNSSDFACRNWDTLLFSAMFGNGPMANYNLAYNLASIPTTQIGEHIGDVLLPSFARLDAEDRSRTLVRAMALMGLIIFPLAVGLGAVSETLVATLFNEEWQSVAPYLMLLAMLSVVRPAAWIIDSFLQAEKQTLALMYLGIGKIIMLLSCMIGFGQISALWACAGVGIAFGVDALASMWVVNRKCQVPISKMALGMLGPLLACVPMAAAVLALREFAQLSNPIVALIAECTVGGIVYIPAAFLFAGSTAKDFLGLLKKSLGRG